MREGVLQGEFYIFTLPARVAPAQRAAIEGRAKELLAALEAGELPE